MDMQSYEDAHRAWLDHHLVRRTGERRDRLERGHLHAEHKFAREIWWVLRGSFKGLHPEYEVMDWRNRSFFVDFVFILGMIKIVFEIKGYGAHVTSMDRRKYCNELNRETFLTAMGYTVISIAYDDIEQRPELVIQLIRMVLSRFMTITEPAQPAALAEKDLIRLAITLARPLRPVDVVSYLGLSKKTALKLVKEVCGKGWLVPLRSPSGRTMSYRLVQGAADRITW